MEQCRQFLVEGKRIAASMHIPADTPAPGLVMCHGFTGHRIEAHFLFVKAARTFCAAGLNVLRFDFRGSGESEGQFREMTIEGEIADTLAALAHMRAEPTVDAARVGLLGLSLGGLVAACAASRDGGVPALVLWSAVANLPEVLGERLGAAQYEQELAERGFIEQGPHELGAGFIADLRRIDPLAELSRFRGKALVVHGSDDESVPVDHADRYLAALAGVDAIQHIVVGADHTFSTPGFEREVIQVTCEWLTARLGGIH
ncbi:MAG: alpha/beta hydrolase family protein [Armatimonadota bacterium]